LREGGEKILIK